jgi:hypothetical protein
MSRDELRQILAEIARDEDAYPRDRIAAIKALHELGLLTDEKPPHDEIYADELAVRRSGRPPGR